MAHALEEGPALDPLGSQSDSVALVYEIEDYWRAKGHRGVRVWIEGHVTGTRPDGSLKTIFVIRSNLVNGWPPPELDQAA